MGKWNKYERNRNLVDRVVSGEGVLLELYGAGGGGGGGLAGHGHPGLKGSGGGLEAGQGEDSPGGGGGLRGVDGVYGVGSPVARVHGVHRVLLVGARVSVPVRRGGGAGTNQRQQDQRKPKPVIQLKINLST